VALLDTVSRDGGSALLAPGASLQLVEPVATSTAVRDLVAGPRQRGQLIAALPHALYVRVGREVVAVVSADAVRLPLAMVLASPAATTGLASVRGPVAHVGVGELSVGSRTFRTARWWEPARPRVGQLGDCPALSAAVRGLDAGLADVTVAEDCRDAVDALGRALGWGAYVPLVRAVAGLVGRGPGLTPTGDDVLAGALATLRALGAHRRAELLACAVQRRLDATSALSAALLRHACAGDVVPEAAAVLRALGSPSELSTALPPLLGVGGSSGGDLATGILVAARTVLAMAPEDAT
jgi:hypothetical protein